MEVSDALGAALGAVTEQGVLLAALREVAFERLAADERTALARSVPERAAAGVREGVAEGALSPEGSALLLDPLASLDEFAFIARAVAERPELWGEAVAPHAEVACGATMQLLPVIRRVQALEADDLDRAPARLGVTLWNGPGFTPGGTGRERVTAQDGMAVSRARLTMPATVFSLSPTSRAIRR